MTPNSLAGRWISLGPYFLSLLRIVGAFLFIQYGGSKILGWPAAVMPGGGTAPLASQAGVAGLLELGGGALLIVGLFTRPVAFVLCGFMAVAYFMAHGSQGNVLVPLLNQGELAVLYCFVFLYFVFSGAGAWSIDAARQGRRTAFGAAAPL